MPYKCCVPGCKSNYNLPGSVICKDLPVFFFPNDEQRRELWQSKITEYFLSLEQEGKKKKNFQVTKNSVVCIKHFEPEFLITYSSNKRKRSVDGFGAIPLKRPRLTKEAYPSIFLDDPPQGGPSIPSDLSLDVAPERGTIPAKYLKYLGDFDQKEASTSYDSCKTSDDLLLAKIETSGSENLLGSDNICSLPVSEVKGHRQRKPLDSSPEHEGDTDILTSDTTVLKVENSTAEAIGSAISSLLHKDDANSENEEDLPLTFVKSEENSEKSLDNTEKCEDNTEKCEDNTEKSPVNTQKSLNKSQKSWKFPSDDTPPTHKAMNIDNQDEADPQQTKDDSFTKDEEGEQKKKKKRITSDKKVKRKRKKKDLIDETENKKLSLSLLQTKMECDTLRKGFKEVAAECFQHQEILKELSYQVQTLISCLSQETEDPDKQRSSLNARAADGHLRSVKALEKENYMLIRKISKLAGINLSSDTNQSKMGKHKGTTVNKDVANTAVNPGAETVKFEEFLETQDDEGDTHNVDNAIKAACSKADLKVNKDGSLNLQALLTTLRLNANEADAFNEQRNAPKYYRCDMCQITFLRRDLLFIHKKETHKELKTRYDLNTKTLYKRLDSDRRSFVCEECGAVFKEKRSLDNHLMVHSNPAAFSCEICQMNFAQPKGLKQHQKLHLQEQVTGERYLNRHTESVCETCGQQFKSPQAAKKHNCGNPGVKKIHKCVKCSLSFDKLSDFYKHNMIHKKFPCVVCGRMFCRPKDVKTHYYRMHFAAKRDKFGQAGKNKNRSIICNVCGKSYKSMAILREHMMIHTGEKKFECDVCHVRFRKTGHLKNHYRRHTDERPYACKICGQRFRRSGDRLSHERRHSGQSKSRPQKSSVKLTDDERHSGQRIFSQPTQPTLPSASHSQNNIIDYSRYGMNYQPNQNMNLFTAHDIAKQISQDNMPNISTSSGQSLFMPSMPPIQGVAVPPGQDYFYL